MYADMLRSLAAHDIIVQAADKTLLPGRGGERILNDYHFYAAFQTPEEYRLIAGGRALGTLSTTRLPVSVNTSFLQGDAGGLSA